MSNFFVPANQKTTVANNNATTSIDFRNGVRGYSVADDDDDFEERDNQQRSADVEDLMRKWESKYSDYHQLCVFAGTFNVNGQPPPTTSNGLRPWLSDGLLRPPDIYAVGFQELDLSQQAFLFDSTPREKEWAERVREALYPHEQYEEIQRCRLIGMFLLVYVRKQMKPFVSIPCSSVNSVGTGILNRMGNKGGVAASLRLQDTRLCIVNSHLAAGTEELQRRNQDFREISRLAFQTIDPGDPTATPKTLGIFEHDAVIWLGDLNYRLQRSAATDINSVKKKCSTGAFVDLLMHDQLRTMQQSRTAWHDFVEGDIKFPPTYKYDPGTDHWDSSEKARVPAWCDRVLWLANDTTVQQEHYRSVNAIRISDHKPVSAVFNIRVKRIDPIKYRKRLEDALRESDRRVNEALPQISIDTLEFDFGSVKFLEPKVLTLTMQNTGLCPVLYKFKRRPGQHGVCKRFITATPSSQRIDVGKQCMVDIQVLIDKEAAWKINELLDTIEDVMVLHLRNGRDYFLTIKGHYQTSCFGRSLLALSKEAPLIDLSTDVCDASGSKVPRQLQKLVSYIKVNGLSKPDLFSQAGSHQDFSHIRDALDAETSEAFAVATRGVYSVVEALLRFLDSLPEPVVPNKYTDKCLSMVANSTGAAQVASDFDDVHRETFDYLLVFLIDVLKHSDENGTTEEEICMLFAPVLLGLNDEASFASNQFPTNGQMNNSRLRQQQAMEFLQNCLKERAARSVPLHLSTEQTSVNLNSVSKNGNELANKAMWDHFA